MKHLLHILAVGILSLIFLSMGKSEVAAAPPANFQLEQVITTGLDGPSGFEIAPDGRVFILERTGKIKVVKNGELLEEPFADLPSVASGDRGLIGIAFDPAFGIANHYVYFYYTGNDLLNRLVRFDASSDVGTNGPFILYQTTSPSQELHVGGSIQFGPDGKLYFAVGDNGYPPNAQNLSNPHGKILRINKDGSVPLDNPFFGQPNVLPEIWAYGFRNPWRFQFDSATGNLFGADVGDFTWEEMNHIRKGQNYGWPMYEGDCTMVCGNTTPPLYTYNHNGESASVTGGPVYRGDNFPQEYVGSLFFGDYAQGVIKRITLDELGNATGTYDFDLNAGSVVDLKVAGDGSLYYITYYPGRLYRVSYSTGNQFPSANATADNLKGIEPHTVNFSSEGSSDPDGDPLTFLWEFGDGTTSTQANPVKTYTLKGTYTVELAVSDGTNTSNAVPLVIQTGTPPMLTVGAPQNDDTYRAGDTIYYTAHAIDAAGFDMNDGDISTEVFLHHDTHFHPFVGPLFGRAGSFTIPTTGEASANTWYEIRVTVTDGNGLTDTESVTIYPETSTFTLSTVPAGLQVNLDGVPKTTPAVIAGVIDFERELNVPTTQVIGGVQYQFERWSDNKSQKHFISTQEDATTYTAYFRESPSFTGEYFNNIDLAGEPVLERQDQIIDFFWGGGSPDPVINIDNFSVRWSKDQYFAAGKYLFSTATDDGHRLIIDGQVVIDEWMGGVTTENADVTLTAGEHEIVMEYREMSGGASAKISWDLTADQPVVQTGFESEYFANTDLSGNPVLTQQTEIIDFDWGGGSPDAVVPINNFSARFTKIENVPAGVYEFHVKADDGVRLLVDGELILDKWIDQASTEYSVIRTLPAGSHTIVLEYYEKTGGAVVSLDYHKHSDVPVSDGYEAEYFVNRTLSGIPVLERNEDLIDFDWGGGSPDAVVPVDNFSARFTKTETFVEGTYEFTVRADDGFRLLLDGELILDKWIDQAPTTYKVSKTVTAGNHTIVVEYYEKDGGAVAEFSYVMTDAVPPPPTGFYSAEYFNNMTLTGPAALTRADEEINFNWGGGSPAGVINANNFSARWTKTEAFTAGNYEFSITGDDGVRVIVDGDVVIDKFIDQPPTTYKAQKSLTAGNHTVIVEYYEKDGGAVAEFNYVKVAGEPIPDPTPDPEPTDAYEAKYWNLTAPVTAPEIPNSAPMLEREDEEIDFDWSNLSPDSLINPNGFVAQWTRQYTFEEGNYTFTTVSDDGIRAFIDGEAVINEWNDHGSTTHTGEKVLSAGVHEIKVEYYEKDGGAVARFSFEKSTETGPTEPEEPIGTDFRGEYFNNMNLSGTPILVRHDELIDFDWNNTSPDATLSPDNFSVRWTKTQQFTAGEHSFVLKSDDGIRFFIDDQLIVDDWTDHAMTTYTPTVTLTEDEHLITIEYYEKDGGAVAIFEQL